MTVAGSSRPGSLIRSTQKPFSGLWKVTRSMGPFTVSAMRLSDVLGIRGAGK
jgi:hypothetical protein